MLRTVNIVKGLEEQEEGYKDTSDEEFDDVDFVDDDEEERFVGTIQGCY